MTDFLWQTACDYAITHIVILASCVSSVVFHDFLLYYSRGRVFPQERRKHTRKQSAAACAWVFPTRDCLWLQVWCSSDGVEWECVSEAAPWAPRGYVRAVTLGDRMFVLGGGSYVFDGDEPGNPSGYIAYNDVASSRAICRCA